MGLAVVDPAEGRRACASNILTDLDYITAHIGNAPRVQFATRKGHKHVSSFIEQDAFEIGSAVDHSWEGEHVYQKFSPTSTI